MMDEVKGNLMMEDEGKPYDAAYLVAVGGGYFSEQQPPLKKIKELNTEHFDSFNGASGDELAETWFDLYVMTCMSRFSRS